MKVKVLRLSLLLVGIALIFFGVKPAAADGIINWDGQGSDNLPCESGGLWVIQAPDATSVTAVVNNVPYGATQQGNGAWHAESGPLPLDTSAYATYTGDVTGNTGMELSHCIEGEPTPTPTATVPVPTDTPTNTPPPPTETPTTTPPGPSPTPTETPPGPTKTPTPTQPTPTNTPGPTQTPTKPVTPTVTPTEPTTGAGGASYPNVLLALAGITLIALTLILPRKLKTS